MSDHHEPLSPLSRRSFLGGLAALAGSLALDPFHCVRVEGRHYENVRLGIAATLPTGWTFASIADFASLRERQVLLDQIEDEFHPLKDPDILPIFLFEAPRFQDSHFGPAIALYDEPLYEPAPVDESAGHVKMLAGFATAYRGLEVIAPPSRIVLRGAQGTVSTWSYAHDLDSESSYLVVRSVVVFRGERVHTYHLVDDLASPRITDDVWDEFLASIRYSAPFERPL